MEWEAAEQNVEKQHKEQCVAAAATTTTVTAAAAAIAVSFISQQHVRKRGV